MVDKSKALQMGDSDVDCINKEVGFESKWQLSFIGWVGLGRWRRAKNRSFLV